MSKLHHKFEYAALICALSVFRVLPLDMASALGGAIFRTIGPRMGANKTALRHIALAFPEYDPAHVAQIAKGMWDNLGRVVAEYPHLDKIGRERVVLKTPEYVPPAGAALFVSGHLGNWEAFTQGMVLRYGVAMNPVYRAPNNPYVDKLILKYRAAGGRLRSFGKNRKGLAETLKALQNGEVVGMLIDQKMNTGIEVPFFGHPAMTSTAFVELSRKLGCPLVPGRLVRTQGANFEIWLEPHLNVEGRSTEEVVGEMHRKLEGWIREYPEQWLWLHKRWKD